MNFQLLHTDPKSNARAGLITTDHGQIETPIFMPVGTVGSVKAVHMTELQDDIEAQIILGNTYHLYLRPGLDVLQRAGGLHKFNSWSGPILTDSGGFQVFSLTENRKLSEEGAEFRSHIDGSKHFFTPEKVIDIQRVIGADIMMAFDECTPGNADYNYAQKSLELTERWLDRCIRRFHETECTYGYRQTLFPHCTRMCLSRPEKACCRKYRGQRCRWQCHWRFGCGRTHRENVRNGGTGKRYFAEKQTPLSDGSGKTRQYIGSH